MSDEFRKYWDNHFPNCPPILYLFKKNLKEVWFRIHSLPQSKRYAENELEIQEILRRQRIIFNQIIGEVSEVFLACLTFDESLLEVY